MSEFASWVAVIGVIALVLITLRNSHEDRLYRDRQELRWREMKTAHDSAERSSKEALNAKLGLSLKVKDLADTVTTTIAKVEEMDRRNSEVFMKMREFGVMIQEIDNELEKKLLIHERETLKKVDWLGKVYSSYYDLKREKVLRQMKLKKDKSA